MILVSSSLNIFLFLTTRTPRLSASTSAELAQFDEPAEEVEWRGLRLDDEREDDSWRVRLELQSVERGSITRTIRLLPAGLLDDFDV